MENQNNININTTGNTPSQPGSEVEKYFKLMTDIFEKSLTQNLNTLHQVNAGNKALENVEKVVADLASVVQQISYKINATTNEHLKDELQRLKELMSKLHTLSEKSLEELKEHSDDDISTELKEKLNEIITKLNSIETNINTKIEAVKTSVDTKTETIKTSITELKTELQDVRKDRDRLDNMVKVVGIGLSVFAALFSVVMILLQNFNTDKIEKMIGDKKPVVQEIKK